MGAATEGATEARVCVGPSAEWPVGGHLPQAPLRRLARHRSPPPPPPLPPPLPAPTRPPFCRLRRLCRPRRLAPAMTADCIAWDTSPVQ
eukprot:361739-Chlamydomonas_euryale.AAC.2